MELDSGKRVKKNHLLFIFHQILTYYCKTPINVPLALTAKCSLYK